MYSKRVPWHMSDHEASVTGRMPYAKSVVSAMLKKSNWIRRKRDALLNQPSRDGPAHEPWMSGAWAPWAPPGFGSAVRRPSSVSRTTMKVVAVISIPIGGSGPKMQASPHHPRVPRLWPPTAARGPTTRALPARTRRPPARAHERASAARTALATRMARPCRELTMCTAVILPAMPRMRACARQGTLRPKDISRWAYWSSTYDSSATPCEWRRACWKRA
mmetsp:Transcript_23583/g.70187  ORF Transcript_23583/g.70187 Transcript_23583/m.70187 type:complete len:219 (+) Transcript_23583:183-839(+)